MISFYQNETSKGTLFLMEMILKIPPPPSFHFSALIKIAAFSHAQQNGQSNKSLCPPTNKT